MKSSNNYKSIKRVIIRLLLFLCLFLVMTGSLANYSSVQSFQHSDSLTSDVSPNAPLTLTISNETIWENVTSNLTESVVIDGGNLTILNSYIDFSNTESGFIIANNGFLQINDSIIKSGDAGASGDSNGSLFLQNATFYDFSAYCIHLEGDYSVIIDQSTFRDTAGDALDITETFDFVNITNSLFLNNSDDALDMEEVLLYVDNCLFFNQGDEHVQYDGPLGAFNVRNSVMENTTSKGNGITIEDFDGTALLENVTVEGSLDDGIQIRLGRDTNLIFRNIEIVNTRETGLEAQDCASIILEDSRIINNGIRGVELRENTNIALNNCTIAENVGAGLHVENVTYFSIENSNISFNTVGGAELESVTTVEIVNTLIRRNTGSTEGSNGLNVYNSPSFQINDTIVERNTGTGITLEQSTGSISECRIAENGWDGISLFGTSTTSVKNSTIAFNIGHGIYFGNVSTGIVHYNNITGNEGFGLFAEIRQDEIQIDANYNYWGSDEGPAISQVLEGARDDFSGPVNISVILTAQGQETTYTPPTSEPDEGIDYQLLLMILVSVLAVGAIGGLSYWAYLWNNWKREVDPRAALLISHVGLSAAQFSFPEHEGEMEATLLSGFLTALQSLFNEMMGDKAKEEATSRSLKEVSHDVGTIIMRAVRNWGAILIVTKSNPLIRRRMDKFARELSALLEKEDTSRAVIDELAYQEEFEGLVKKHFFDLLPKT